VFAPVSKELNLDFHGLEWTLLKLHRAVMKRGKITGSGMSIMILHRAVLNFLELSPGWNDFHRKYTGGYELTLRIIGLFWVFVEIHRAGTYPTSGSTGLFWI
jgi:hypothetical protein